MKYRINFATGLSADKLGGMTLTLRGLNTEYNPRIVIGHPDFDGVYLHTDIPIEESHKQRLDYVEASQIVEV